MHTNHRFPPPTKKKNPSNLSARFQQHLHSNESVITILFNNPRVSAQRRRRRTRRRRKGGRGGAGNEEKGEVVKEEEEKKEMEEEEEGK